MLILSTLRAVLTDRKGVSSLEYALLAVGVLTGLLAATQTLGSKLDPIFSTTIPALL